MLRAVADTQAVVWYLFDDERLSPAARSAFEQATSFGDHIGVSSVTLVEIVYLVERARIPLLALSRVVDALLAPDSVLLEIPLNLDVAMMIPAVARDEVSDMPDRIVAATALQSGVPLISSDRQLRSSAVPTIW